MVAGHGRVTGVDNIAPMYSSTFIFATKQFDDAFHRLDQAIATAARSIEGYLGDESWEDAGKGLVSNVYYWKSLEALQSLMQHPTHLEAKAAQAQWLNGYQVVISQVLRTYGDAKLEGLLPTAGLFAQGSGDH
jgi:heme-degrading monooxygenase HmoA